MDYDKVLSVKIITYPDSIQQYSRNIHEFKNVSLKFVGNAIIVESYVDGTTIGKVFPLEKIKEYEFKTDLKNDY